MNFNAIQPEKSQQWIKGLDTLRFVFALIVLLSHLPDPWANTFSTSDFLVFKYLGFFLKVSTLDN
jgi:peptidoglycan/LPS O-acetylase OafA/YrhL